MFSVRVDNILFWFFNLFCGMTTFPGILPEKFSNVDFTGDAISIEFLLGFKMFPNLLNVSEMMWRR